MNQFDIENMLERFLRLVINDIDLTKDSHKSILYIMSAMVESTDYIEYRGLPDADYVVAINKLVFKTSTLKVFNYDATNRFDINMLLSVVLSFLSISTTNKLVRYDNEEVNIFRAVLNASSIFKSEDIRNILVNNYLFKNEDVLIKSLRHFVEKGLLDYDYGVFAKTSKIS